MRNCQKLRFANAIADRRQPDFLLFLFYDIFVTLYWNQLNMGIVDVGNLHIFASLMKTLNVPCNLDQIAGRTMAIQVTALYGFTK